MKRWFLFLLIGAIPYVSVGQEWLLHNAIHGGPKFRGGITSAVAPALFLGVVKLHSHDSKSYAELMDDIHSSEFLRWIVPTTEFDIHTPVWAMKNGEEDIALKGPDWYAIFYPDLNHNFSYALGYEVSWKSLTHPYGGYLGVDYECRQICIKDGVLIGRHRLNTIVPTAGVRLRLLSILNEGFEMKHNWDILVDIGAAYAINVKYHNFYNWDVDAVNNGFRLKLGLGFSTVSYGNWYVRYEIDCYNFFNSDYHPTDGSIAYFSNYTNTFNSIVLGWKLLL